MDSDNESFHSESEFYYPEGYRKEMDKYSNTIWQNNKNLDEIQELFEKRRPAEYNKKDHLRFKCVEPLLCYSKGRKNIMQVS